MGKEELIQYFGDAIALETEIVTQENLVSQFEAMSENKKPVLVERKVQVAEPDPNGLDSETNAVTFFLVANTVIFSFSFRHKSQSSLYISLCFEYVSFHIFFSGR